MNLYPIPAARWDEFLSRIAKLSKRAEKLGRAPIEVREVDRYRRALVATETGNRLLERDAEPRGVKLIGWREFVECEVTGEAPKLEGWEFLAVIEPADKTGEANLVVPVPGRDVPAELIERHTTSSLKCDHCGYDRRRNETFLVRHEDGRVREVGRTCLADFLGHKSPESVARYCGFLISAADIAGALFDEEIGGGSRIPEFVDLPTYLAVVSACIRKSGWLSRSAAFERYGDSHLSTSNEAVCAIFGDDERLRVEVTDADKADALAAVEWAESLEPNGNDYLAVIHTIAEAGCFRLKRAGYAASILPSYRREVESARERELAAESDWFGEIKKRDTFKLTLLYTREIDSPYGLKILYVFADENGNRAKWFCSGRPLRDAEGREIADGATVTFKATVKAHEEYRGARETVLTRAALVD